MHLGLILTNLPPVSQIDFRKAADNGFVVVHTRAKRLNLSCLGFKACQNSAGSPDFGSWDAPGTAVMRQLFYSIEPRLLVPNLFLDHSL
jgi:transposase